MGTRFLIVDDSANIRAFVKKTLSLTGLTIDAILEAQDGQDALEKLEQNPVDVVLTDINMPRMDGLELIRRLRADERYRTLRVIVISTEGSREKILEAAKIGITGYLKKPFGPENVLEILEKAVLHGNQ
jgi:two-component system chemotaxis response regulator CheY